MALHDTAHAEANTRLIAAAPDLLDACLLLLDRLKARMKTTTDGGERDAEKIAVAKATSAIASVQGTTVSQAITDPEEEASDSTFCPECGDPTDGCDCEEPFEVREQSGEVFARFWKLAEAVEAANAEEKRRGADEGDLLEVHINPHAIIHNQLPGAYQAEA